MNDMMQTGFDYAALPVEISSSLKLRGDRILAVRNRAIYEIGKELYEAQQELAQHRIGCFVEWIISLDISVDSAYRMINVYENIGPDIFAICENKKIGKSVLYLLAQPSLPKEVKQQAVEKIENGELKSVAELKQLKADYETERQARELFERRAQESQSESNERRKTIRTLEEQIDLLTIRDRMMQGRLEKADEEISYLATVVPEPEKVIVAPDDYEHLKQTERDLRSDLAELKQQQRELVQQQVVAKLKERESELAEIDRKVQHAETLLAGLQTQIDRYSMQQRELKVHLDTIENARVAMALLAANLEGFGEVIDRDHELRQWRALADMLRNGAAAIEYFIGHTKPVLSVVNG